MHVVEGGGEKRLVPRVWPEKVIKILGKLYHPYTLVSIKTNKNKLVTCKLTRGLDIVSFLVKTYLIFALDCV